MGPVPYRRDTLEYRASGTQPDRFTGSSVQFSHSLVSESLRPHESQHARLPCRSPTPGVYSNPCPSSWWCHPTISSSAIPFSSCLQSFPALGSFPMSQFFTSGGLAIKLKFPSSYIFNINKKLTNFNSVSYFHFLWNYDCLQSTIIIYNYDYCIYWYISIQEAHWSQLS